MSKNLERIRWLWLLSRSVIRFLPCRFGVAPTSNERRLMSLRDSFKGRRCFILGNGPSLKQTNLDRIAGELSIASNAIYLLFPQTRFRPTFWTVEDHLVAEDRAKEIDRLRGMTKIVPMHCKKWLNRDADTIYNHVARRFPGYPRFSEHFEWVSYCGDSVTHMNLQLAFYLGCTEVYLVGVDHFYHPVDSRDRQTGRVLLSQRDDPNHFDPSYFGPGYRWHEPRLEVMERAYRLAREVYERHGRVIYNATLGGRLEVFPRVSFEDLFRPKELK